MLEFSLSLECIFCPLKYQVMVLTGSEATLQTMETFLPLGTVKYMEVGDNCGAHANSARLKLWMWIPTSLRGPWQDGSTIWGTLLWVSHKRKLRSRQSQVHLKCNAQPHKLDYVGSRTWNFTMSEPHWKKSHKIVFMNFQFSVTYLKFRAKNSVVSFQVSSLRSQCWKMRLFLVISKHCEMSSI